MLGLKTMKRDQQIKNKRWPVGSDLWPELLEVQTWRSPWAWCCAVADVSPLQSTRRKQWSNWGFWHRDVSDKGSWDLWMEAMDPEGPFTGWKHCVSPTFRRVMWLLQLRKKPACIQMLEHLLFGLTAVIGLWLGAIHALVGTVPRSNVKWETCGSSSQLKELSRPFWDVGKL